MFLCTRPLICSGFLCLITGVDLKPSIHVCLIRQITLLGIFFYSFLHRHDQGALYHRWDCININITQNYFPNPNIFTVCFWCICACLYLRGLNESPKMLFCTQYERESLNLFSVSRVKPSSYYQTLHHYSQGSLKIPEQLQVWR